MLSCFCVIMFIILLHFYLLDLLYYFCVILFIIISYYYILLLLYYFREIYIYILLLCLLYLINNPLCLLCNDQICALQHLIILIKSYYCLVTIIIILQYNNNIILLFSYDHILFVDKIRYFPLFKKCVANQISTNYKWDK